MNNNKGKSVRAKDLPIVTPGTHANGSEHLETGEVVGNINKFCKNLLDKNLPPRKLLPIKEYTIPENVSNVMKEWRNFEFTCGKPLKLWKKSRRLKKGRKRLGGMVKLFQKEKPTMLEKEEVADKKEKEVLPMDLKTGENSESDEGYVKELNAL
ncbi:hypothetical protein C1646_664855 [Rhizophagus diaphanus]|nr:hypothetical protein C1646_664855 [Rhizophagus diaphanus] [Rhizophagus sp. MUCL 43196]